MNLLLDIGNSRLKWVVESEGFIGEIAALDYRQADFLRGLKQRWQCIDTPKKLAIASVSEKQVLAEIVELSKTLWPAVECLIVRSSGYAFEVTNAYAQPEKLGVDRWLAMIAAHRSYPGAVCVVDCGTAITVDSVQGDGKHLGGLICPGLRLMKKALASETADLTFENQPYHPDLATETQAAIANGVLLAAAGLIQGVMDRSGADCRLVLTGGDASIVGPALTMPLVIDQTLVMRGLAMFCSGEQAE